MFGFITFLNCCDSILLSPPRLCASVYLFSFLFFFFWQENPEHSEQILIKISANVNQGTEDEHFGDALDSGGTLTFGLPALKAKGL